MLFKYLISKLVSFELPTSLFWISNKIVIVLIPAQKSFHVLCIKSLDKKSNELHVFAFFKLIRSLINLM